MSDPYKVLGISRDATDDEVKQAYRKLSRKYHPDANINNPNKDKAEEMFKLVGQAYNQIMDERKNGYSSGYGGSYGGYGSGSYGSGGYGNGGSGNGNYGGGYSGNPFDDLFGGFGAACYGFAGLLKNACRGRPVQSVPAKRMAFRELSGNIQENQCPARHQKQPDHHLVRGIGVRACGHAMRLLHRT